MKSSDASTGTKRPSVSTGTGDDGMTTLYGGHRAPKLSPRIRAFGTVDEMSALLGCALAEEGIPILLREQLISIQKFFFRVGADLATPMLAKGISVQRVAEVDIERLEQFGVSIEASLPPLQTFILPGGSPAGAHLHLARTVCRRAERMVMRLSEHEEVNPCVMVYLNRLSDYFFLVARAVNKAIGAEETTVEPNEL